MDRLTAFVEFSLLKLRADFFSRYPHLLDGIATMEIKGPIELAGMKSRLARAAAAEARLGNVGKRYDAVLDKIDEATDAIDGHAGQLEKYEGGLRETINRMVAGSNGGDPLDGDEKAGDGSDKTKTETKTETVAVAAGDIGKVEDVAGAGTAGQKQAEPHASWSKT